MSATPLPTPIDLTTAEADLLALCSADYEAITAPEGVTYLSANYEGLEVGTPDAPASPTFPPTSATIIPGISED